MKLTKSEMQVVVNCLLVQHDCLFEIIMDKHTSPNDIITVREDERILRKFLLQAKEKGLEVENSMYSMDKKIKELDK